VKNIFAVIVTYNGMQWIDPCLASLAASVYPTVVLVIDNGSADGTAAFVRDRYPGVQLVVSPVNLGFGQANNIGLKMAIAQGADHVFLLNQDARVERDTIGSLVKAQTEDPGYGILSPVHYNGRGDALDANFLDYFLRSPIRGWADAAIRGSRWEGIMATRFVNAAAWLISADCLRATGFFDPVFFHYGEDENYAQRVLFHGSRIGIYMGARIFHDREVRLSKADMMGENRWSQRASAKEWMQVLVRACDIRQSGYTVFLMRRLARHSLSCFTGLIAWNKPRMYYHFSILKNILSYWTEIGKSRARSLEAPGAKKKKPPHEIETASFRG